MTSERSARPFLVDIQNVDISSLDFRDGSENKAKSRHVTFVEATTLFLFVGSTSGTVYLFSRETLDFLLMIPFKGGKVCNISVSNDESEVAVASIRGRVSIYRISPNLHLSQSRKMSNNMQNGSSGDTLFRHLYDISHHVNNEVTEIKWSSNGKFLFVGDNQGVISQTDVGSLQEFPRPPSRVILKLSSRILQIDCSFPYLAVSTLAATFLCDLEKEDFTRIQSRTQGDIRSAGLCIVRHDGRTFLIVGEVGTGSVLRCGMDGSVISSTKVDLVTPGCNMVECFNPKYSDNVTTTNNESLPRDLNYSPGKMFASDNDQFIVSVSSNRIFVQDTKTCKILLWNEHFNRINSLKIIANYAFLWYANKLQVFALTPFRPYGKQLFKAGLNPVLENWISYALASIGYHGEEEEEDKSRNNLAIKTFREIMSPVEEEDEFCEFVSKCVSFDLIDPEVKRRLLLEESYDKKLARCVKQLVNCIKVILGRDEGFSEKMQDILEALQEFYVAICDTSSQLILELGTRPYVKISDVVATLLSVLRSTHIFLKQPQLISLKQDLSKYSLESGVIQKVIVPILSFVRELDCNSCEELSFEGSCNFLRFGKCPLVQKYFSGLGIFSDILSRDALIADVIVLLLPLIDDKVLFGYLQDFVQPSQLSSSFFTWLILMTFFGDKTHSLPFSGLLRTLQNPQYFEKLAEEIYSSVYREVIFPRGSDDHIKTPAASQITCFTHFTTFIVLYSKSPEISKSYGLDLLLNLFPLKRGVKEELIQKMRQLTTSNSFLFRMYYKACLEDGRSLKGCGCGIQAGYGSLDKEVPPFQRAIEEAIFQQLVGQYFQNQSGHEGENEGEDLLNNTVHDFAMKRCLVLKYFESSVADDLIPDDKTKIAMILRSGVCGALQHLRFNLDNLQALLQALKSDELQRICGSCGCELGGLGKTYSNISRDCVGVWMLENVGSVTRFMQILDKVGLNTPGDLSLRFYQLIIKRSEMKAQRTGDFSSSLTCSLLHYKLETSHACKSLGN